jgi:hypothetical protein
MRDTGHRLDLIVGRLGKRRRHITRNPGRYILGISCSRCNSWFRRTRPRLDLIVGRLRKRRRYITRDPGRYIRRNCHRFRRCRYKFCGRSCRQRKRCMWDRKTGNGRCSYSSASARYQYARAVAGDKKNESPAGKDAGV